MMTPVMNWRDADAAKCQPAPQPVTPEELLTICRVLDGAGLKDEGIYTKIKILTDYAIERHRSGRRYILLKTE